MGICMPVSPLRESQTSKSIRDLQAGGSLPPPASGAPLAIGWRNRKFRNRLAWTNTLAAPNRTLDSTIPAAGPAILCAKVLMLLWAAVPLGDAWANTCMISAILYFCLHLYIFHQQSFISKVNPEEVRQEFCDFFLFFLQPELLNGSALHSETHRAAALLLAQRCKLISPGSLRMEESWMPEGQLTILSSNPMLPASYTQKAAQ